MNSRRFPVLMFFFMCGAVTLLPGGARAAVDSSAALSQLREGNARYVAGESLHPNQTAGRRGEIAQGQSPRATVLACSDSRVSPEIVFDQGLGDLFVVRVAGNVAAADETGTIEYGVGHLHTRLLVVMGHTGCGAVKAAVEGMEVHGSIPALLDHIAPAVARARAQASGPGEALFAAAVKANVWQAIDDLFRRSAMVRELVKSGELEVIGAVYDLASGTVTWHGAHPEQVRLLNDTAATTANAASHGSAPSGAATHGTEAAGVGAASPRGGAQSELALTWKAAGLAGLVLLSCGLWVFAGRGMRRWTIGRRITVAFGFVLSLVAISAIAGFIKLTRVKHDAHLIAETALPALENIDAIKSHVSELQLAVLRILLSSSPSEQAEFEQTIGTLQTQIDHELDDYEKGLAPGAERQGLAAIKAARTNYTGVRAQLLDLTHAGRMAEAIQHNAVNLRPAYLAYQKVVDDEARHVAELAENAARAAMRDADSTVLISNALAIASLLFGITLATAVVLGVSRVLSRVSGDLAAGAEQASAAASQVSAASQLLAEGSSEQAASLEETSSSLEELSSMTKRNAESAARAKEFSHQTRGAADSGAADMAEMKQAMDAIKTSSDDISKIIKAIDEIAFQTNILALNAAVEAARAGESGMGFAVVAEEVRGLAQRSAESARETAAKIEDSVRRSEHGVNICGKVAQSLNQIVEKARQVDTLIAEIAAASQEQSQGIGQLNTAVGQMDKVTQSNAGSAEETAAAAEEMSAQAVTLEEAARELRRLVDRAANVEAARSTGEAGARRSPARGAGLSRRASVTRASAAGSGKAAELADASRQTGARLPD